MTKTKPNRYFVNLLSANGTERLRFQAVERGGEITSWGFHSTQDAKTKKWSAGKGRGATQHHANFEDARKAVDGAVASAVKLGWVKEERKAGGATRQDAFDLTSLPKPEASTGSGRKR